MMHVPWYVALSAGGLLLIAAIDFLEAFYLKKKTYFGIGDGRGINRVGNAMACSAAVWMAFLFFAHAKNLTW